MEDKKTKNEPPPRPVPTTPKPVASPKPSTTDEDDKPFDEEKDRRDGWAIFGVWL